MTFTPMEVEQAYLGVTTRVMYATSLGIESNATRVDRAYEFAGQLSIDTAALRRAGAGPEF